MPTEKLRVLHVIARFNIGGTARYLCNLFPKISSEVAPIRLLRFCDLVSPVVRREAVCIRLEHPPLILGSDCRFLYPLPHLVSVLSLA